MSSAFNIPAGAKIVKTLQVRVKDKHASLLTAMARNANMAGQRFGRLVAIDSFVEAQRTRWNCACDCGNVTVAEPRRLRSGHKQSCGCAVADARHMAAMTEAAAAASRKSVTGQRFGRLLVGALQGRKYACVCDCGATTLVERRSLVNGDTKSCGCLFVEAVESRAISRRRAAGLPEDQPMSAANLEERNRFRALAAQIKVRDGFACVLCGAKGGRLATHHIEPWAGNRHARFDTLNLVTLCRDCHLAAHGGNFHGPVDPDIAIRLRVWACGCGTVHDRDVNAARNIRHRGLAMLEEGAVS